jgi:hypothetical protein
MRWRGSPRTTFRKTAATILDEAVLALEAALRDMSADRVNGGFSVAKEEGQQP